jgi:choline dehydrogenase-like flavoprotein/pimeloyl-ACP methyl ester carboxylesterase
MTVKEGTGRPHNKTRWLSKGLESLIYENRKSQTALFDIVVIGSGYGGAVAAAGLAGLQQHGKPLSLCVLERGREFTPGAFPASMTEAPTEMRFSLPGHDMAAGTLDGLYDFRLGADLNVVLGNGLGGGSLINAGVMQRPKPDVFDSNWPKALRGGSALEKYLREAEELLGARHNGVENTLEAHADCGEVAKFRSIQELGKEKFRSAPVTIAMQKGIKTSAGVSLEACTLCGDCASGCNHGAKISLDTNLLAKARQKGAEIYTGASVVRLEKNSTDCETSWTLHVVHTRRTLRERQRGPFRINARYVIVAAGSLGSTELLMRSEDKETLRFSSELGKHFSSNGDMLAAGFDQQMESNSVASDQVPFDERHVGPTITGIVDARDHNGRGGIVIEEMAVPAPLQRVFEELVTTSSTLHSLSRSLHGGHRHRSPFSDPFSVNPEAMRQTSLYAVMGDDGADGELRLPRATERSEKKIPEEGVIGIHWPGLNKKPLFNEQIEQLERLSANSRVEGKILPNPAWKLLPESMNFFTNNQLGPLATVHPLGGCVMGDDLRHGVVDEFGCVYDGDPGSVEPFHEGLVVLDGAVIPTAIGINPALTITAVALRAVNELRKFWHLETGNQEAQTVSQRPWYRQLQKKLYADYQQTEIQVIERLSGEVRLRDKKERVLDTVVEITLAFAPVRVRELAGMDTGEAGRMPARLKTIPVADGIPSARSRLRIFTRSDWENLEEQIHRPQSPNELRLRQERVEELKDAMACYAADVSGTLEVFGRGNSFLADRILRALWAWIPNRGLRDTWQHLFPLDYEPKASGGKFFQRLRGALRLASHAGEKRLLEYSLTVDPATEVSRGEPFDLADKVIKGHKTFTYGRRSNPWRQLSQMRLTKMQGMIEERDSPPLLCLDTRFLSRINVPLIRLTAQQDQVNAMLDLFSLGAYLARMMIGIHLWSFRKPDAPLPDEPDRLPGPITGLPRPGVVEIQVDTIPDNRVTGLSKDDPVVIHLTHYRVEGSTKPPVVMIHGYSASGTSFTHDTIDNNFTKSFWQDGRDVWILDMRTSPGLPSARYPWSFEDVAGADIPVAIDYIYRQYENGRKVDVLAHCMGAVMFSMAALNPDYIIDRYNSSVARYFGDNFNFTPDFFSERVRSVIFSQVTPTVVFSPDNKLRAFFMQYFKELMPDNYQFRPEHEPTLADDLIDRLLYTLPYPEEEFDIENPPWNPRKRTPFTRTRHRMDALYGRDFNLKNVDDRVLERIDDLFGPLSIDTVKQTIHFARLDTIATKDGLNLFVTEENLEKWTFPTFSFNGVDNGLSDDATAWRSDQIFNKGSGAHYRMIRNEGFGHQDSLISNQAREKVFPALLGFLHKLDGEAIRIHESCPPEVRSFLNNLEKEGSLDHKPFTPEWSTRELFESSSSHVRFPWRLEKPWFGPVIFPQEGEKFRILTGADPAFGNQTAQILIPMIRKSAQENDHLCPLFDIEDRSEDSGPTWKAASQANRDGATEAPGGKPDYIVAVADAQTSTVTRKLYLMQDGIAASEIPASLLEGDGLLVLIYYGRLPKSIDKDVEQEIRQAVRDYLEVHKETEEALVSYRPCDERNSLCVALGSCQYPAGIFDGELAYRSWELLNKRLAESGSEMKPDMLLLMGDQIYADATAGLFDPESAQERYEWPYRKLYTNRHVRNVLRQLPVYTMLDDHEIDDNWQPLVRPGEDIDARMATQANLVQHRKSRGVNAYLKYQRGINPEVWRNQKSHKKKLWYDFEHNDFPFFMMDTRTDRSSRCAATIDDKNTTLISEDQLRDFEEWLDKHDSDKPKFVISASILFPRHMAASADFPASALHADGWDGYPQSLRQIVQIVAEKQCRNLVFLSGDEHLSCDATVTIEKDGKDPVVIHSIHRSGLYAPLPFANSRPEDLVFDETWHEENSKFSCSIQTRIRNDVMGFGQLHVYRSADRQWHIALEGLPLPVTLDDIEKG